MGQAVRTVFQSEDTRRERRDTVDGWYCGATGRIHFIHSNLNSLVTMRTFSGNISDVVAGSASMAGTMTVDNVGFGELGEFPFSGQE